CALEELALDPGSLASIRARSASANRVFALGTHPERSRLDPLRAGASRFHQTARSGELLFPARPQQPDRKLLARSRLVCAALNERTVLGGAHRSPGPGSARVGLGQWR